MAIKDVVQLGFGAGGSIARIVMLGFGGGQQGIGSLYLSKAVHLQSGPPAVLRLQLGPINQQKLESSDDNNH
jgi:hypothetical protein